MIEPELYKAPSILFNHAACLWLSRQPDVFAVLFYEGAYTTLFVVVHLLGSFG